MKSSRFLAVVLAALALVPGVAAAQVVDQFNPAAVNPFNGFESSHYFLGQTFTPTANTVAGAGIYLTNWYEPGPYSATLAINLWTGNPNSATSTLLASGAAAFTTTEGTQAVGLFDVFWAPVSVTPGQQYFLDFITDNYATQTVVNFSFSNAYTGGGLQYNGSSSCETCAWSDYSGTGYDLQFQEYSGVAAVATPEPASLVLLGTGLIGITGVVRRKRRA